MICLIHYIELLLQIKIISYKYYILYYNYINIIYKLRQDIN